MKAVIPTAGLGTRLMPATKEQPKEMLPVFASYDESLCIKPLVQLVFEQLFDTGYREFCFVVGRNKRAIEDHFTPDRRYVEQLDNKGKNRQASLLESFYRKVEATTMVWINQPEPLGFGHAVQLTKPFVGTYPILVHAGDTYIISRENYHLKRLVEEHNKTKADATIALQEIPDPRSHGVAEVVEEAKELMIKGVEEKPERPRTNLAIMPLYIFEPIIFRALEATQPGKGGEIQLTDGIQKLIEWGLRVNAIKLKEDEIRLDIGTPETYWAALSLSYKYFKK
ncbi:MAG: hypothetical protein L6N95_04275 [Candidatus Methylarchaceae archaeon HK01B]|nr:hypothetical protein [Candidatus Methylarchaceae archaeon HK01M]MCP8311752.1 hypothetical protein [Candidatus Methylarchaceae archaeon HK02M1]MCP8319027.1 hypothetical protein [Candidatus Methylarchaceae archaeon HK01B]